MFVIECFKDDTNESSCTYDFFRQVVLVLIVVTNGSGFNSFGFGSDRMGFRDTSNGNCFKCSICLTVLE